MDYYFLRAAVAVESWVWPFTKLGPYLRNLADVAYHLAHYFWEAYEWSGRVMDDITEALHTAWDALDMASAAWNRAIDALTEIPSWVLTKLSAAYDAVQAIASVIGTTSSSIIQFVKDHAETIVQYIAENIYNTYQTVKNYVTNVYETVKNYITNVYETVENYITNVYETITNIINNYVTEIIGASKDWVTDLVNNALADLAAPINLITLWFDAIQGFFNDPWGWLVDRFEDWFLGPEK